MTINDFFIETIGDRTFKIPMRFGNYQYIKTLGKGSFSVVVMVQHVKEMTYHACKVVSRDMMTENGTFKRFEQEVRLLHNMKHPYIVALQDVIYEKEFIYIVMEYCVKGDLFKRLLVYGPYEDPELRVMFRKIVLAIQYIHSHNIAHRDIKPENILIDANNNPKIADFGLCHQTNRNKLLKTPCGSPFYAPPEIIQNDEYDGKLSDVWSLGVVLFTMATGSLPWTEVNQTKLFLQIQRADFEIPTILSPPVQSLLQMMMSRNPADRPTIDQILENPWLSNDEDLEHIKPTSLKKAAFTLSSNDAYMYKSNKRPLIVRPDSIQKTTKSMVHKSDPLETLVRKIPSRVRKCGPTMRTQQINRMILA